MADIEAGRKGIETNVKYFIRHVCCVYFACPDPIAGGLSLIGYVKRLQGSRFAQRLWVRVMMNRDTA